MSVPTQESAWAAPVIMLSLVLAAAFLGYYQLFYLPSVTTPLTTTPRLVTPFNVTVDIVFGSQFPTQEQNFVQNNITLVLGFNSTVIWVNQDTVAHTATGDGGEFDTGLIDPGGTAVIPFPSPGVYNYHCTPHPFMRATVTVIEAAAAQAGTPQTGFIPLNLASLLQGVLQALSALATLPAR